MAKGSHFLDQGSFETHTLSKDKLGDALDFLVEGAMLKIQKFNGNPIGLELPSQVELEVTYCEPGARGNTSSGSVTKLAKLETGIEVKVPLFIEQGEKVKIYTETHEFRRPRIRRSKYTLENAGPNQHRACIFFVPQSTKKKSTQMNQRRGVIGQMNSELPVVCA